MKIRFIDNLNSAIVEGTRRAARVKVSAVAGASFAEESLFPGSCTVEARHSLVVFYDEKVDENAWQKPEFKYHAKKRAAKVISRHLYGDMENRLHDALEALWADGLYQHDAALIIGEVIAACRGESSE